MANNLVNRFIAAELERWAERIDGTIRDKVSLTADDQSKLSEHLKHLANKLRED